MAAEVETVPVGEANVEDAGGEGLFVQGCESIAGGGNPRGRKAIAFEGVDQRVGDRSLDLTRYEYGLLACLIRRPGRIFTRENLMQQVWEDPAASSPRTVDAHIKTLRAKLQAVAPQRDLIRTHRGFGYALETEDGDPA